MEWACQIDWQALASFANAAAILAVGWWARYRFDEWKRQAEHRRRSDSAFQLLTITETVVQELAFVRFFAHSPKEANDARTVLGDAADDPRKVTGQIVISRIVEKLETWKQATGQIPIARVLFGDEVAGHLNDLIALVRQVRAAAVAYANNDGNDEFQKRMQKKIISHADDPMNLAAIEDDELLNQSLALRQALRDALRAYIVTETKKPTLGN